MNAEELKYLKALQPGIREAMGNRWNIGDKGYCAEHDSYYYYGDHLEEMCCDEEGIRVPLAIDPENPGRGLWGMVKNKWGKSLHETMDKYPQRFSFSNGDVGSKADTLYLALLKALAAQWGVGVPNE